MGEIVIKKWRCDRCHAIHDNKPHVVETVEVSAHEYLEWAVGELMVWKEMCQTCNWTVRRELRAMLASAKAAQAGEPDA
ncbi:hypothetical protein [Falsiroseomonas tokyonensis]|uniref:HNH endonuclease n=1 Tax=Falsiroseomonas tokyonensis TaxID=430521 RepID=A0ABV7C2I3_9PROT|nr:hypothetical protein [Falsiroseomonas tokyonensis]MBU8540856.1 hypothetical protein [Falsiroseomonas tokyonensis]